jgi:hypothetical protein
VAQPEPGLDLKIAVQRHSQSNLTELERICREEWEKLSKYSCAKLVASYPRRLEVAIAAKGASTKSQGSEYLCKCSISVLYFFNQFANISKNLFLLCHYWVLCVDLYIL